MFVWSLPPQIHAPSNLVREVLQTEKRNIIMELSVKRQSNINISIWNWTTSRHTGIQPRMVLRPKETLNGTRDNSLFNRRCPGHIRRGWINSLLAIGIVQAKRSQLFNTTYCTTYRTTSALTQHVACILPPCCDMQIELMRMPGRIVARTQSRSQTPRAFWKAPRHGTLE